MAWAFPSGERPAARSPKAIKSGKTPPKAPAKRTLEPRERHATESAPPAKSAPKTKPPQAPKR